MTLGLYELSTNRYYDGQLPSWRLPLQNGASSVRPDDNSLTVALTQF